MKTVRRLITAEIIGFVLGVFDRYYPGVGIAIGLVLLGYCRRCEEPDFSPSVSGTATHRHLDHHRTTHVQRSAVVEALLAARMGLEKDPTTRS